MTDWKFFNANQQDGRDPAQSDKDKRLSGEEPAGGAALGTRTKETEGATKAQANKGAIAPQETAQPAAQPEPPQGPTDVPKTRGTLTIAFGRFNPPTIGHQKLLDAVANSSDEGDYLIFPSRSEDKKKNPLGADRKFEIMQQMYPDHADRIVNDASNRTIFDVLRKAHEKGYANIRVVGGGDRVKEYDKLVNKYNGSTYQFDNVEVVNAGDRDPDSEGAEGMSASKMRKAAKDNDFRAFLEGLPDTIDNETAMGIFSELQDAMGIAPKEPAVVEDWEIAPRLYTQQLREEYIQENVFNIGDTVTHDSTGMTAEIVRKGTNHLICVTEDEKMFKTWTQDVSVFESAQSIVSRVGTSFRKFISNL